MRDVEELARGAVDRGVAIHRELGPGLLMNFGETFREGLKRVVNNHTSFASSRLRVNQSLRIEPVRGD